MRFFDASVITLGVLPAAVSALSAAAWRSQSIYQVLTDRFARTDLSTTATCNTGDEVYCGGTWQGLIDKLDYIQGMGFTAIWISPIVENLVGHSSTDGSAYHGYWAQDIYSVNSNFGTETDLINLSAALHSRAMYLMVDVVTNHMAYLGCGTCVDYSIYNPFNSQSYFHPFCLIDYSNETSIKVCWEGSNNVALPDMRTEDSDVLSMWNSWVTQLVSKYSIDGIRLDSTQQVDNAFLTSFQAAADIYIVGEVFNGDPNYVCPYQNYVDAVLNYPARFYWITQAFQSTSGSISNLVNGINTMKSTCADTTLLGSFLENHDNPRFPSLTGDLSLNKNAIAFTMLSDGIPIVYYGQEQDYSGSGAPYDREALWFSGYSTTSTLYTFIAVLNQIRNQAIYKDSSFVLYKAYPIYSSSDVIAMRKGFTGYQIISVFTNAGSGAGSSTLTLTSSETGFTASQALVEVTNCTSYTTDSSGNLNVAMSGGLPRIFYPSAQLTGSGICGSGTCSTSVAVTFDELKATTYGQTAYIVGNTTALGGWGPVSGVALSASLYTSSDPLGYVTLTLVAGTAIAYKNVMVDASGIFPLFDLG